MADDTREARAGELRPIARLWDIGRAWSNGIEPNRLLQNWSAAHARSRDYLEALGLPRQVVRTRARQAAMRAFERDAWEPDGDATSESLRAVRELLLERLPAGATAVEPAKDPFLSWRLARVCKGRTPTATPPLQRRSMPTASFTRVRQRRRDARRSARWPRIALRRRLLLAVLVLIPSAVASGFMQEVLPQHGATALELAIVLIFGALFGWISIGFWTALLGFWTLVGSRNRLALAPPPGPPAIPAGVRTAIVMPIADEPVERVFAGLRSIERSLERTGLRDAFDFFVLSDTRDPGTWIREEEAWARWCCEVDGFGRIFYRRRRVRLKKKSGNVADFVRRWGSAYRYMVMLDADSVMSGDTLARLVQMMESQPDAGILQTAPVVVNGRTLFGRVQQFASRVYGPMFAAGLHYWQLGDGPYWGHNAIVRIAPFREHCGLPRLSGRPPLGGDILSHDFVEAALLGRAGYTLWLAFDLGGSYEEGPASLLEEARRDRRWCQGNLQHLRLLFTRGVYGAHRMLFLNGVFAYVSAVLWLAFLALSTAEAVVESLREPDYFPAAPSLFPEWPIWRPDWAAALLASTAAVLFLPKVLAIALVALQGATRSFGGLHRLVPSVLLEILVSSLFAPIRMLLHSRFVLATLVGRTVGWRSGEREDAGTGWGEALRQHGPGTVLATLWGTVLYRLNPDYFWWLAPILGALVLSIPLSVLASRVWLGEAARRLGLLWTPEEIQPPLELQDLESEGVVLEQRAAGVPPRERDGFWRAVVDPYANALHRSLLRGTRAWRPSVRAARDALVARALAEGPEALDAAEQRVLLGDAERLGQLHDAVWARTGAPPRPRAAIDDPVTAA